MGLTSTIEISRDFHFGFSTETIADKSKFYLEPYGKSDVNGTRIFFIAQE